MNRKNRPDDWRQVDELISEALHSTPVSLESRMRARQYLIHHALPSAVDRCLGSIDSIGGEVSSHLKSQAGWIRRKLIWGALLSLAASALMAVALWKMFLPLSASHLIAVCIEQVEGRGEWRTVGDSDQPLEVMEFQNVLSRVLRVAPGSPVEYRWMDHSIVSDKGRLWRLPIEGRGEIYVLEFESPRAVEGISSRIQLLSGISRGWSMAAVSEGDRLFVFISKDRLKDSLNLSPLA